MTPTLLRRAAAVFALILVAACTPAPPVTQPVTTRIAALEAQILSLGPGIDPAEAARAAQISFEYTDVLKTNYEITDPPLIHNTKVNLGIKPRGLCWHWAEDMEARLLAEGFKTLDMHRAIANDAHPILIAHSTAVISRAGDDMEDGIVLDPWRYGGTLFFETVKQDTRYPWLRRDVVIAARLGIAVEDVPPRTAHPEESILP
ncbi:MAG: hypothetical protein AAFN59_03690 [Pseudomonadota bacterium]